MADDLWCLHNPVDTAVISATGSVSTLLGPSRVADPRRGKVWRPNAAGDMLTIAFAAPVLLEVIAIFGVPQGAGFTLAAGSTPGASDVLAETVWNPEIDGRIGQALWIADDEDPLGEGESRVAAGELRITNTQGVDIGRVWAGPVHWRPAIGHVIGAVEGMEDLSSVQRARSSAAVFARASARLRRLEVAYDSISPAEWDGPVYDIAAEAGTAKQILFLPRRDLYPPARHALLGYQEAVNPIEATGWQRFQRTFILKEGG